ncbi:MAG TPA: 4-alpha-glucanotransferase [Pyrinomonadaceae bacterium]|nr:4-alpha-glucanotransferase [Pyrinomonadaceae bacterium]
MFFQRASGVLLHPTSLPTAYGIGDFGPSAYSWIESLHQANQTYWQMLPLGPTGFGDSPYQCFSAFAGNTLLVSPERLVAEGLIGKDLLQSAPQFDENKVDYGLVADWKRKILENAFENFTHTTSVDLRGKFETFVGENAWWLEDYALFRAIKNQQEEKAWYEWEEPLALRDEKALKIAAESLYEKTQREKFYQFLFFRQWAELKAAANNAGIKIIGDIPIFIAADSADVWCNQDKFKLEPKGRPRVVAGVPPDYFSQTGQLWGNPIYDWQAMLADGFSWWRARVAHSLRLADIIRIDHFRGFVATWEVPADHKTAEHGRWVDVPGRELFTTLKRAFGELPIIAEDLGVITPEVESLRDDFRFPGMRILQFAFGGDPRNHDLPHNYVRNCVAYTGTHDNDTTVGWWNSVAGAGSTRAQEEINREQEFCKRYLNTDGKEINWDFIRAVWASVADTAITPLQDILGIGTEGRMNLPASTDGNWRWRFRSDDLKKEMLDRLAELTAIYGRSRA